MPPVVDEVANAKLVAMRAAFGVRVAALLGKLIGAPAEVNGHHRLRATPPRRHRLVHKVKRPSRSQSSRVPAAQARRALARAAGPALCRTAQLASQLRNAHPITNCGKVGPLPRRIRLSLQA
eukprot:2032263-Rhodomonas_salina.2